VVTCSRGRVVGTLEAGAVRGIDHQVDVGQLRRCAVAAISITRAPRARRRRARDPAVVAVVPTAFDDHHRSTVGTAEKGDRMTGDRGAGALDEHFDGLGCRGIDRRHLVGRDDRDHSATTIACATVSL
jgi:hypothetical protein